TSISFAGAIAVAIDNGTTSALLNDATVNAGTHTVTVSATPTDKIAAKADGTQTGDTSGNGANQDGVGIAVAIDYANRDNRAFISGSTSITGNTLNVGVLVPDDAHDSTFNAEATSGAGNKNKVSVAGSAAINIVMTTNEAYLDTDATLTLGSANTDIN